MNTGTNDPNPAGTRWWNNAIYGSEKEIYPEEDHQVASLPITLLYKELGNRVELELSGPTIPIEWRGKIINFSAVSDSQLLHHIGVMLNNG